MIQRSKEEVRLDRLKMVEGIASAGYDALCAILELEFLPDGQVWRYYDVPEQAWYEMRKAESPVIFFHTNIQGKYPAERAG